MESQRWQRVKELFSAALALPEEERSAYLRREAGDDAELVAQAEALLAAHGDASGFLTGVTLGAPAMPLEAGAHLGPYVIERLLGEGGFGSVYVARQEQPVRRRVALKVLRAGWDQPEVLARFQAERQALAMMSHPHIAQVYDAGTSDSGRPYFAMELVEGRPITEYCDAHQLSTAARLELFVAVCHAVQHAHARGVLHRDLKPGNVLVTVEQGQPFPKVIDFGIAKALEGRLSDATLITELHQLLGTPEYMSPEQVEGEDELDVRTDVYSLGVLLYELLSGCKLWDRHTLRGKALERLRAMIRDYDPPSPSRRLEKLTEGQAELAARRASSAAALPRLLRGDLDQIVMKALAKDRRQRYAGAESLAADVQRFLHQEPVQARPPGRIAKGYRFLRRHRVTVSVSALLLVVGLMGLSATTFAFVTAQREREMAMDAQVMALRSQEEAEQARAAEQDRVQELQSFIARMLAQADPTPGRSMPMSEFLQQAVERAPGGEEDPAWFRLACRQALADALREEGQYLASIEEYRSLLDELRKAGKEQTPEWARALQGLTNARRLAVLQGELSEPAAEPPVEDAER